MTVANPNDLLSLPKRFQNGVSSLEAIADLLEQEKDAIVANDLDKLKAVLEEKKTALIQFAEQQREWSQIISAHGRSIDEFFAALPPQAANMLRPHWDELDKCLQRINALNERNGNVVGTRNRQVSQLLSILQGHRPSSQLYTDGGSRNNYGAQSRLGKA